MKQEEERISFLSSSNLYWNVKGLTELYKKGVVFYSQVFDFEFCDVTWRQGCILGVLFIQVVIDSIYINFMFLACWGLYKDHSSLIVSSEIVNSYYLRTPSLLLYPVLSNY